MKKFLLLLLGAILSLTFACTDKTKKIDSDSKPKVVVVLSTDSCLIPEFTEQIFEKQIVYYGFERDVEKLSSYMDKDSVQRNVVLSTISKTNPCVTYYDTIIVR